ncbi:DUF4407 domain-containing protein [Flavobacterium sp. UBA6135]|uniref:DUF4407 domain-containing protein n=1 Tax=Flavobacterium sp. UBA6135 TaxID=1946553 RepID=UPI0025C10117|nr:DUF4407 domain-containing protein [Flavobacterium sp. UBA6135]
MKRDYYESPKAGWLMKQMWTAAGGDRYLLERATYSDQIKYMCLGGIVFATGAMAGIAGGYAYYTIFEPRSSAIENPVDMGVVMTAVVFGILWGLMIFNIDRFIVTSTGKGDGTEEITWLEFKGAIPRILMGAIIAITISKPVEIRMFKTEIDAKLYEKQLELQKEFEKRTTANFEERLKIVEADLGQIANERKEIIDRIKIAEKEYTDQLQGRAGAPAGDGKLSQALKQQLNSLKSDLDRFDQINSEKLKESETKRKQLLADKDIALSKNVKVAEGLDGLLERIKLAHEVAGFWITLFITLLFMAIELTPVFFKLMLIKSPYDYLAENRDELIKAEKGIEIQYDFYTDKEGVERHLVINHEAHRMIYEKKKVTEIQKELTDYAIEKYKEREKKKIDDNLDDFIKTI